MGTFYPGAEGYPAWTDRIRRANVIDMAKYSRGKNDFAKFESARDERAARASGGPSYPAGT